MYQYKNNNERRKNSMGTNYVYLFVLLSNIVQILYYGEIVKHGAYQNKINLLI